MTKVVHYSTTCFSSTVMSPSKLSECCWRNNQPRVLLCGFSRRGSQGLPSSSSLKARIFSGIFCLSSCSSLRQTAHLGLLPGHSEPLRSQCSQCSSSINAYHLVWGTHCPEVRIIPRQIKSNSLQLLVCSIYYILLASFCCNPLGFHDWAHHCFGVWWRIVH